MFSYSILSIISLKAEENCLLCDKNLGVENIVIVRDGLGSLIKASKQKGDGKHSYLNSVDEIRVHTECRKNNYTRSSSVTAAKRKRDEGWFLCCSVFTIC